MPRDHPFFPYVLQSFLERGQVECQGRAEEGDEVRAGVRDEDDRSAALPAFHIFSKHTANHQFECSA